jgi:hypothetical protein
MALANGSDGIVKVGTNTVLKVEAWSIDKQAKLHTAEFKGATQVQGEAGVLTNTGSITVFTDVADTTGQGALGAGTALTDIELYLDGTASGDSYYDSTDAVVVGEGIEDPMDYSKTTFTIHFNNGPTLTAVA